MVLVLVPIYCIKPLHGIVGLLLSIPLISNLYFHLLSEVALGMRLPSDCGPGPCSGAGGLGSNPGGVEEVRKQRFP